MRWIYGLLVLLSLSAACVRSSGPQPPDIAYGKEICVECGMIINDPRFAAAYVTRGGQARLFDDIGDMVVYHRKHSEEVAAFYVHDYETRAWIDAAQAFFVQSPNIPSPMGYGLVAFSDRSRAEAFAREHGGEMKDWARVLQETQPPHGSHSHGP
ncbi:nitrous oxide reductase accessory protein NosL [Thermoflexus sp.]|uniref:nitrous oxide reductase accessory protein NosL n=1 Tax=Thermoflexus sp. TaxID=1969742 RepID=UPI0035E3F884